MAVAAWLSYYGNGHVNLNGQHFISGILLCTAHSICYHKGAYSSFHIKILKEKIFQVSFALPIIDQQRDSQHIYQRNIL